MGPQAYGRGSLGDRGGNNLSRSVWPADLNRVSVAHLQNPSVVAHEVGHNLSLLHPPTCADFWATPYWPDGIAYGDDAPGPIRQWWMGDWTDAGDGRFDVPRASESDSRLEVGVDVMSWCQGGEWAISDRHYQTALLFRMAAGGWLDMTDEGAVLRIGGAQSVTPAEIVVIG